MLTAEYNSIVSEIATYTYDRIAAYMEARRKTCEPHLFEVAGSYLEQRGKAIRPALLCFACQAYGGNAELALPAAAAVEMFHTWTLIHDDIIDHDELRRGRPAAHVRGRTLGERDLGLTGADAAEYGEKLAILSGDLLHGLAVDMLLTLEAPFQILISLARRMNSELTKDLLSGEQMDVKLSRMPWDKITKEDIDEMMKLKTGALLGFAAATGTALGEGSTSSFDYIAMYNFGVICGMAFQLQDDILGVIGDETKFGKPIGSDIREGKRTSLMIEALNKANKSARKKLLQVLGKQDASEADIESVQCILRETGAIETVSKQSTRYINVGINLLKNNLKTSMKSSLHLELLEQWALSMIKRNV